jgi:DNA polymerase III alpha subunit
MEGYAKRAVDLHQKVLSSVEHGWCGNVWDTIKTAKKYDLKPLIGAEAYWVKDRLEKDNSNCHIVLLAKNENGRQCLNDVMSEANLSGFYRQPRLDKNLILSLPRDDIWVTSACVAGWKYDEADEIWREFADHFEDNFFLEVQYHDTDSQKQLNERILRLHDQYQIPIIMGCDSHYIFAKDQQDRIDFLSSKEINYPDEEGWFLDFPDGDAAYDRFVKQGVLDGAQISEAMSNTLRFEAVEDYDSDIFNDDIKMPSLYPNWTQQQKDAECKRIIWEGWDSYKKRVPNSEHEHYKSEIQKEIDTIIETHTADYFITNHQIIKRGKEKGGRLTKTGRGSAVSFITNMLLGFTGVDRIKASVKMYPERFMSATRILQSHSLPDIDFNVDDQSIFASAQQEILGEDHAYPMVSYGTMKTSAAWKLYAKSQGLPFELANAVSAQIKLYEDALKHADEDDKDSIDVMDYIETQYQEIFEKSADYRGVISSWSIAPCSYILYQGSIRRQFGLVRIKEHVCAAIDGHWAEENHFLKNDILKVSCVEQIYDSYKAAGVELPDVIDLLGMCPPEDKAWELYENGCTLCLNQCEKPGTSARVGLYKPKNISELAAFVAAIRPGFKSMYKIFESRKPFKYGISAFDTLIQTEEMPNSFVLYQEQEMAALNYAGIDMSDCYTAIKNIAKKRAEKVLAYKETFINGFSKTIVSTEHKSEEEAKLLSDKLWKIIEDSARYSFNCVSGDTKIQRAGGINGRFQPTVEQMYLIANDPEYARATCHVRLHKKFKKKGYGSALSMFDDGRIHSNTIVGIYYSGEKDTYKVTTASGKSIVCTMNHKFPTPSGKKELSQLQAGDLLYCKGDYDSQKGIPTYLDKIVDISFVSKQRTYDIEMADPAHTFVSENGLVVSNCSHSYCVALDSLYEAWIKAHYPLAFYQTALRIYEAKGDKDKMAELREEAQNYFNIHFPPLRYGLDNRNITANFEDNSINNSMASIKGFGAWIGDTLYRCSVENKDEKSFMKILSWLDANGLKSSKVIPLVQIDYFNCFGNTQTLLAEIRFFDFFKQGTAKKIKKDKLTDASLRALVARHATDQGAKGELTSYTINDMEGLLNAYEITVLSNPPDDLPYKVKAQNQKDILGYVDLTTGKEEDRRKLYVLDKYALKNKWSAKGGIWKYKIKTKSVGSGKVASLDISPGQMDEFPIEEGNIIYAERVVKSSKGYWSLLSYKVLQ